ncbi:MAG: outer membrane beta-barrel protein [Prevotella sp.]|jgi:hypothetical protein|nr:outer membrane beta-barrel protein [Prevotella sp.]
MKHYLLFTALSLCSLSLSAQVQQSLISGSVTDKAAQTPVEQASVRFLTAKDSTFVNGTLTNSSGKFSIRLKQGRYIAHISYLGYTDVYVNINANKEQTAMGNIELSEDGIMLKEAVVTAKVAEITIKGDTVEYNADSYKVQQSAVVEDLLKRMPGAEVDDEGKITVNGKEVKKILVDGKEFFSDDPKVASKNLPAAMVDKLQVLDRKSDMTQMTGFDDGEEETVINLTVKKGMKQGLFGSATAGYGSDVGNDNDHRYGFSGIANYMVNDNQFTLLGGANNTNNEGFTDNAGANFRGMRGGGMNFGGRNGITESLSGGLNFAITSNENLKWGGNIRYGNNDNDVTQNSFQQQYMQSNRRADAKGDQFTINNSVLNNKSQNIGANLRFEWSPDTLTQIIFSPSMNYGTNQNYQRSDYLTRYDALTDTINYGNSESFGDFEMKGASGRLEVSRKLGKPGRVLSFSLSGNFNDTNIDGTNNSFTQLKGVSGNDSTAITQKQIYNQQNDSYNWRGFVSYVEPIGHNNFIQLNYSYSRTSSESDKKTFTDDDGFGNYDGIYDEVDTTATKRTTNKAINQEIRLNFKSVREKYNYTVGISLQPAKSETWTYQPQSDPSLVATDVWNFAPVAQFNYMWDRRHNLRIDYNGYVNQPSATQLSSVADRSDPLNTIYGNPNLKPGFTNRFNLRYQKFNPEQASSLVVFGRFSFSANEIVSKRTNLGGGISETTYENINGNWNANVFGNLNQPLRNKKFSFQAMSALGYTQSAGFISSELGSAEKNTASTFSWNQNLGMKFSADLAQLNLRGNYSYSGTRNSLEGQQNRTILRYGGSFTSTLFLPFDLTIDSDINYTATSGSTEGYGQNEWMWNASIAKQLFKAKNGTLQLKVYDILQQRSNVSQSATSTAFTETVTNSLTSYFLLTFQYKFQIFKGGAKQPDADPFGYGGGMFRGPGGPPPGGGERTIIRY